MLAWMMPLLIVAREEKEMLQDIEPVAHYGEYFKSKGYSPVAAEKEAVEAINLLVDEFNDDLQRIKEDEDWEALVKFCREAEAIIEGKNLGLKR